MMGGDDGSVHFYVGMEGTIFYMQGEQGIS